MQVPAPIRLTALLRLAAAAVALALTGASVLAQVDTVVVCVGEEVTLAGPTDASTYRWIAGPSATGRRTRTVTLRPNATATYVVTSRGAAGAERITNGGFEGGNTGFTTDYDYRPGGSIAQGTYAILDRPSRFNSAFGDCDDQTAPGGLMYVADGSTVDGDRAWCQRVDAIVPGRDYAFAVAATSLVSANPPRLAFRINGERQAALITPDPTVCRWTEFYAEWTAPAGVTEIDLCIENVNTVPNGNDFALDAVSFVGLDPPRFDTTVVVVLDPVRDTLDLALCAGSRYRDNGLDLGPGEQGTAALTSVAGCDSFLTVVTRFSDTTFAALRTDTLCPGEVFTYNDFVITTDTVVCENLLSVDGCDSVFCLTVKYLNESAISVDERLPTCAGDADGVLTVDVSAGRPPYTYRWGDGTAGPTLDALAAGDYRVDVTDASGCSATRTYRLADPEPIRILQAFPYDVRCGGESNGGVLLTGLGGTGALTTVARAALDAPLLPADALAAGQYVAGLQDTLGCTTYLDTLVVIEEPKPVSVVLRGDRSVRLGQTATHTATLEGDSVAATWLYEDLRLDSLATGDRLVWQPNRSGVLVVVATDENGCEARDRLRLEVVEPELRFFPNAFSPNADGSNDTFGPVDDPAIAAVEVFAVYDRWGNALFERRDCWGASGDAACAWDGTSRGGQLLNAGVYVWYARLRLVDGRELVVSGDVVLVGGE